MAVCSLVVLATPSLSSAAGGGTKVGILGQLADLDLRLQTSLIDLPRWLHAGEQEHGGRARSLRLFLAGPRRQSPLAEGGEPRRAPSALGVREFSFPVRKVAAEHLLTRSVAMKLSVGLDRELDTGGIAEGELTPSVGLQFERRFQ